MSYVDKTVQELMGRLPELEWKLTRINPFHQSLPRGLFRSRGELNAARCVHEIKTDIQSLTLQQDDASARYIADQIKRKINVLVGLCQLDARKKKPADASFTFGLNMLSTRQQWLHTLETDIAALTQQQQALAHALLQLNTFKHPEAVLNLKAELGEIERRLTLAQEALKKATGF